MTGLSWAPVTILVSGPSVELDGALARREHTTLGGSGASLNRSGLVYEDGRLTTSVSGIFIAESSESGVQGVVLTSAVALAPFLLRRRRGPCGDKQLGESNVSRLHSSIDVSMVPTTEIFVMFDSDPRSVAANADVVTCVALPEVEETFMRLQRGLASTGTLRPKSSQLEGSQVDGEANSSWAPNLYGSLSIAVLKPQKVFNSLEDFGGRQAPLLADAVLSDTAVLCRGMDVEITTSVFGVFKPSLFHAAQTTGVVGSVTADKDVILLDARCMPGSEGGVLTLRQSIVPVGLLLPHLVGAGAVGLPRIMGTAVSLQAICRSMFALPEVAFTNLFNKPMQEFACKVAGLSHPPPQWGRSVVKSCFCTLLAGHAGNELSSAAVILGMASPERFYMLVSTAFLSQGWPQVRCSLPHQPEEKRRAASHVFTMEMLYSFHTLCGGTSLVLCTETTSRPISTLEPLTWYVQDGFPTDGIFEKHKHHDARLLFEHGQIYRECTAVMAVSLQEVGSFDEHMLPSSRPGVLTRSHFEQQVHLPTLLEARFPTSTTGNLLFEDDPRHRCLGLLLPQFQTKERNHAVSKSVLPCTRICIATQSLAALFQLMGARRQTPDCAEVEALAELDNSWKRRISAGMFTTLWHMEFAHASAPAKKAKLRAAL